MVSVKSVRGKIISYFTFFYFCGIFPFIYGWFYGIAKDNPTLKALNGTLNGTYFNDQEVWPEWFSNIKDDKLIYADGNRGLMFRDFEEEKVREIIFSLGYPGNSYTWEHPI